MGIFGFLSKGTFRSGQISAGNTEQILIDKKIKQEEMIIERAERTLAQLDKAKLDVYIDKEYVSRGLKERNKQKEERDLLNKSIDEAMDQNSRFEQFQIVNKYRTIKIRSGCGTIEICC